MVMRCSINDPKLSYSSRRLLKALLHTLADNRGHPGMTKKQNRKAMIELYETGFIALGHDDSNDSFHYVVCLPSDAPQLADQMKLIDTIVQGHC